MAKYRKVDPRIWSDDKFCALQDDGKLLFLFLLTHPALTCLGAMRASIPGLADELGWKEDQFRKVLEAIRRVNMAETNEQVKYLALPNFLKYNEPEGPNSIKKAWVAALDSLPNCKEKDVLIQRCAKYLFALSARFKRSIDAKVLKAFRIAMASWMPYRMASSMPSSIQEQEQEQELELELELELENDGSDASWPEKWLWLKEFIEKQKFIPNFPVRRFQNFAWWDNVSYTCGGLSKNFLEVQFAKMGRWIMDHPSREPTERGFRQFVATWLEKEYIEERRQRAKR